MSATAQMIATALRPLAPGGVLKTPEVPLIDQIALLWDARNSAPAVGGPISFTTDPLWIRAACSQIGQREIPGSKNNPWIVGFWQQLGAKWFNDDETPWCGGFAAWCLAQAGLPYPKDFPRAASYKNYGQDCAARLGAIGVKARVGGNHVFFIVGETPDKLYYKALGGNQSDMVNILDIRKTSVDYIRWPAGVAIPAQIILPQLPRGTISTKES